MLLLVLGVGHSVSPGDRLVVEDHSSLLLLSVLMLLGRLEIYTVLAVFWPDRHKHLWYKKLQVISEQEE